MNGLLGGNRGDSRLHVIHSFLIFSVIVPYLAETHIKAALLSSLSLRNILPANNAICQFEFQHVDECFGSWLFLLLIQRSRMAACLWECPLLKTLPRWRITSYAKALKQVRCYPSYSWNPHPDHPSTPIKTHGHLGLTVVLQRHGDYVDTYDKGDDQVQVVAGAQGVDSQPGWTIWRIVGLLLGLWRGKNKVGK